MITLLKRLFQSYKVRKIFKSVYNINEFNDSIVIELDNNFYITYVNDKGINLLDNICKGHIRDIFKKGDFELLTSDIIKKIKSDLEQYHIWKGKVLIKKKHEKNSRGYSGIIYKIEKENKYVAVFKEDVITISDSFDNEDQDCFINEARYSKIFNLCTDLIYMVKVEGLEIVDANLATCRFLESEKKDVLGNTLSDVFDKEFMINESLIESIKKNKSPQRQAICTINNGEKVYFEINYSPICEDDGNVSGILCLARDITERNKIVKLEMEKEKSKRLLEEIKQYDKIKTEFFANISHELRTPINVIFSAIQVMDIYKNNLDYSKTQFIKYSKMMKQNCYRLLRVVNNLIDITKIDSGYFNVNIGNYEIIKILEDITLAVVEHASYKGISITFDTFTEEKMIACDPDKIERIMLNLLSNAIKFTDFGGNIYINIKEKKDGYIYIHVRDNGRGIPKEKVDVIFERFLQVDKSLARDHEGTGIGLYLVKLLVELQGGKVDVKSELNKGTEFIVMLPDRRGKDIKENFHKKNIEEKYEKINMEFSDIYDININ